MSSGGTCGTRRGKVRMPGDVYDMTATNRLLIADVLEQLDDQQWSAPTLCDGWTVREVAGHLLQPMTVGFGRFLVVALRHRGDTDAAVDHLARKLAAPPPEQLIAMLRRYAGVRVDPPRVGPMGPFAETCIHLRDLARPLDLDADVPVAHWRALLSYLVAPDAAPGLVASGRLRDLSFHAADTAWSAGDGPAVEGPSEALAMAITGRPVALNDLAGPGVEILAARIGQ